MAHLNILVRFFSDESEPDPCFQADRVFGQYEVQLAAIGSRRPQFYGMAGKTRRSDACNKTECSPVYRHGNAPVVSGSAPRLEAYGTFCLRHTYNCPNPRKDQLCSWQNDLDVFSCALLNTCKSNDAP